MAVLSCRKGVQSDVQKTRLKQRHIKPVKHHYFNMELKVSDLKRFQKASKHIQSNGVLPIHNYLKFEPGKITKIVTGAFVEFPCQGIDEPVLVDEKMLNNLLNITNSPIITISNNKAKVIMSAGMAPEVAKNMEVIPHYLMYVLFGNKSICGGDGFMAIHYPIEETVEIVLE